MKEFWDERYRQEGYVYGKEPNQYLKEKLLPLTPKRILFPLDGEGRNGVYAANLGWEVTSFDQSTAAQAKAQKLAKERHVTLNYLVSDFEDISFPSNSFDAIALIFAHFSAEKRKLAHQNLNSFLKKDGFLIIEGFSTKHLDYQKKYPHIGGPREINMLYELEALKQDFPNFQWIEATETIVDLNEGNYHKGQGSVVRVFAKKEI